MVEESSWNEVDRCGMANSKTTFIFDLYVADFTFYIVNRWKA